MMRLIARAELIRHRNQLGGAFFELGFWVGGGNTPNSILWGKSLKEDAKAIPFASDDPFLTREDKHLENSSYQSRNDSWNKLPQCPFCNHRTGLRIFKEEDNRLGIVCSNVKCDWNSIHDTKTSRHPIPFLLVDQDIYKRAPSILLGTVDKLAMIGHSPSTINKIVGMFGLARFIKGSKSEGLLFTPLELNELDTTGMKQVLPAYETGEEVFFDPLPSLVIQDEMHLLEESLGTFGGLFETALMALFGRIAKCLGDRAPLIPGSTEKHRMPHVIGATATAADAERQIMHLYQRRVVQFPHPGPRLYESFYTELDQFEPDGTAIQVRGNRERTRDRERLAPWARVYASLLTNGKTHTTATIEILSAHAVTITRWSRDLSSNDPARQKRAGEEIAQCLSGNDLSPRHAAAVQTAVTAGNFSTLARLVDLHRIMLTYVTNKKGGDQLMSALDREISRRHSVEGEQYGLSGYDIELISGGVDIKGIQGVIAKAEADRDCSADDIQDSLRAIVATSAISHGVDVSAFNAMTFAGVPSDIAEYIQASSRVGRTHVGFSLLIPTPQTRRDRFVIDNHETFHRFLERMISPPAIERWADKAVKRTLPSLIQTYLIGVLFQQQFCKQPDESKNRVVAIQKALSLRNLLASGEAMANQTELLQFLEEAIGLNAIHGGAPSKDHYVKLLAKVMKDIVTELQSGRHGGNLLEFWGSEASGVRLGKPMTSLRDVDESGVIQAGEAQTSGHRRVRPNDVRDAMDFITKRLIAGRRSSGIGGELSVEGS